MSDTLHGVIVSHGDLAQQLVDAVGAITGEARAFRAVSNTGLTPEDLCRQVDEAVGAGPAVVFVDMPAGSCLRAALAELHARGDVAVVAGVNLPMLLDFVYHRDMEAPVMAERLVEKGKDAIRTFEA
jgi:mannose/fructose-specific phosphotransferase system component IIA